MKAISKDHKLPQISRRRENGDDYNLNVTDFLKKDKEKVFTTLVTGSGRLEIRAEGAFLVFSSKNDKKHFCSELF